MTIYVDNAFLPFNGMKMCHMMTDGDVQELHDFAQKIGLRREWFQEKNHPHYDVSMTYRAKAINLGARSVNTRLLVQICVTDKRRKANG